MSATETQCRRPHALSGLHNRSDEKGKYGVALERGHLACRHLDLSLSTPCLLGLPGGRGNSQAWQVSQSWQQPATVSNSLTALSHLSLFLEQNIFNLEKIEVKEIVCVTLIGFLHISEDGHLEAGRPVPHPDEGGGTV